MGVQRVWVDINLVLLDVAPDGGDFSDALNARECVAHVPVLGRSQLMQVPTARCFTFAVAPLERVPEHLPKRCRIRSQRGLHAKWQRSRWKAVELLEETAPRPVELDVVIEDDEDGREPKHRGASDAAHTRHPKKGYGQRIRDLVLDVLWRAALPRREDDLLVLSGVRDGVDGHRVALNAGNVPVERGHEHSPSNEEQHEHRDNQLVLKEEANCSVEQRGVLILKLHLERPYLLATSRVTAPQRSIEAPKYGLAT